MANDLAWFTSEPRNTRGRNLPVDRVSFSTIKSGHVVLVFGSKAYNDLELKDGRIVFAIKGGRLYFRGDPRGWKLTKVSASSKECRRLQITCEELFRLAKQYEGCYVLQYDTIKQLYFIQFKED